MVLLVPKTYGEIILGFDLIMLTTVLLFRKPKHRQERSIPNPRSIGWYIVISSAVALIVSHFVSYASLVDYYMGLGIDSLIFYMGLRCLYG
ncbi:ORF6 [Sulfolobus spindle-shaped virus 3]|nr:ORF6 [Sulfolobus spindle-shaped virus 3]